MYSEFPFKFIIQGSLYKVICMSIIELEIINFTTAYLLLNRYFNLQVND